MPSGLSLASFVTPLLGAVATNVVGSIFGSDKQAAPQQAAPAAPVIEPVTPMPTVANTDAAKKKSIVAQIQRQGRASSILTAGNQSSDAMG